MADPEHEHYEIGTMQIDEQRATYDFFTGMTKWGSLALAALMLLLVLWTSTGAGWLGSILAAVILLALGIFLLREKKSDAEH